MAARYKGKAQAMNSEVAFPFEHEVPWDEVDELDRHCWNDGVEESHDDGQAQDQQQADV
jgi:hypothetical protein